MKTYHTQETIGLTPIIEKQALIARDAESLGKAVAQLSSRCTVALYVTQGNAQWMGKEETIIVTKGDMLIHNMDNSKAEIIPENDFGMIALCVSTEFNRNFSQSIKISWKIRQELVSNSLFHLSLEDRRHVMENYEFLIMKCSDKNYPQRPAILKKLLYVLSIETMLRIESYISNSDTHPEKELYAEKKNIALSNATSAQIIFNRFTNLLEKVSVKNRPVAWWASQMNISPKYLSAVCREVSGKSARTLIAETVIQEAVLLLQNPCLTIKEISDKLGFVNQSHFGTFFKRHTGHSPIKSNA